MAVLPETIPQCWPAMAKVLETYELLETIIESLPPRDILLAQRVCSQFQAVIARSRRIRQKLHLEPHALAVPIPCPLTPKFFELFVGISLDDYCPCGSIIGSQVSPGGSWRPMFAFQPPPSVLLFPIPRRNAYSVVMSPPGSSGITLGMIADGLQDEISTESRSREKAPFLALRRADIPELLARHPNDQILVGFWPRRNGRERAWGRLSLTAAEFSRLEY